MLCSGGFSTTTSCGFAKVHCPADPSLGQAKSPRNELMASIKLVNSLTEEQVEFMTKILGEIGASEA